MAVRLLVPAQIRMIGIDTSLNTFLVFVLFVCCIYHKRDRLESIIRENQKILLYTLVFIGLIILCTPFGVVPMKTQFSKFLQTVITEIVPALCVLMAVDNTKQFKYALYTLCICSLISALYGLYTFHIGGNPYFTYMITKYGDINELIWNFEEITREKGGLTGYAAGIATGGPLVWSQITLLSIMFLLWVHQDINKWLVIVTILLLVVNCFLTGQRSAFLAMLFGLLYIYRRYITIEKALAGLIVVAALLVSLEMVPHLYRLKQNVYSTIFIWDDSYARKAGIGGSSFKMRTEQTEATIKSLHEDPLFGKGYSYSELYHKKYGSGKMLGFESLFFKVGWESGIIGFIAWGVLLFGAYKYTYPKREKGYHHAFYFSYFITILLTGVQSTLYLFMILTVLSRKKIQQKKYILHVTSINHHSSI